MKGSVSACLLLVVLVGTNAVTFKPSAPKKPTLPTDTNGKVPSLPIGTNRIVGGLTVNSMSAFYYQLSMQKNGAHICGASIIHQNWALTAAHCMVATAQELSLRAGSVNRKSGGTLHNVTEIIKHESYNKDTQDYDITLLRVHPPFPLSSTSNKIALAASGLTIAQGKKATVSGWGAVLEGFLSPDTMRAVNVSIIAKTTCNIPYGGGITDRMMCAGLGGKDSCQGDSGGPLVMSAADGRKIQIGVVSWGYGCARPLVPGVYSSVPNLRSWINSKTGVTAA